MYFYLWNQWQILPEKSLIRKFRLLLTFYTIQYSHSYGKSNLGSSLIFPILVILYGISVFPMNFNT